MTWSFLHKQKIFNVVSIWVTATVCFYTGTTCFHKLFFWGGGGTTDGRTWQRDGTESWSFTKSATLHPSLSHENHSFAAFIFKQASIHGILFFSTENYLCSRLICNIWQWKSSSWMHSIIYLQHIPLWDRLMLYMTVFQINLIPLCLVTVAFLRAVY